MRQLLIGGPITDRKQADADNARPELTSFVLQVVQHSVPLMTDTIHAILPNFNWSHFKRLNFKFKRVQFKIEIHFNLLRNIRNKLSFLHPRTSTAFAGDFASQTPFANFVHHHFRLLFLDVPATQTSVIGCFVAPYTTEVHGRLNENGYTDFHLVTFRSFRPAPVCRVTF